MLKIKFLGPYLTIFIVSRLVACSPEVDRTSQTDTNPVIAEDANKNHADSADRDAVKGSVDDDTNIQILEESVNNVIIDTQMLMN